MPPTRLLKGAGVVAVLLISVSLVQMAGAQGAPLQGVVPSVPGSHLVVANQTTIDVLASAADDATTLTVTEGGAYLSYVIGAPSFVNSRFLARFQGGAVPAGQPLILTIRDSTLVAPQPLAGPPGDVSVAPGDDIQALVDRNPSGTTFHLAAGVYRQQSIRPKDGNSFIGAPGAILNGARLLTSFEREGNLWVATGQTQQGKQGGACVVRDNGIRYGACKYPEQLFIDGEILWQVANKNQVTSGSWYFDYGANRIYFADDPSGRTVETSVTAHAFQGDADDVTIRGLVIEKYAAPAQRAAVEGRTGTDWLVEDNELRFNHGYGLRTGHRMRALGNHIHHNGQLGVGGAGADVLIEGNEIAYNNISGFAPRWEGGGSKWVKTTGLVVRDNHVHHNEGPGLWTDIDNVDTLYEGNRVEYNAGKGIVHEISYAAVIRDNVVAHNGLEYDVWLWGAQITVQNSVDVEVTGNEVTVDPSSGNGIAVINQSRGTGIQGPWVSRNAWVHHNQITYLGSAGASGVVDDDGGNACDGTWNNRFDHNTYRVTGSQGGRFMYCGGGDFAQFQERLQEANGQVTG
ncbi:MAG: right-handed parallel beta-helix repeat-containing protein [Dehalococcoidia bacterium]|nr:right-handed parallel beta-helix repeat-containing protein [Dehalococcoidia bacterium]